MWIDVAESYGDVSRGRVHGMGQLDHGRPDDLEVGVEHRSE